MRRHARMAGPAMLARSFAIQASWNYRTLVGTGFAFALMPALRARYGDDPEALSAALARHAALFNSHPYLAPMALGAVARLELDGADTALIERFKTAVRGSLGSLGDRLVWAGWRPATLLLALLVLAVGGPWWAALGAFLLVYNIGHVWLRVWSLRLGLQSGVQVGERLSGSVLTPGQRLLGVLGPFLVGALLPLAMVGGLVGHRLPVVWMLGGLVAAIMGLRYGGALRSPLVVLMVAFALVGLLIGWIP